MLICIAIQASSQDYKTVAIKPFGFSNISFDSLYIQKIEPSDLDSILNVSSKTLCWLYKPYCRGLKTEGFENMSYNIRYCDSLSLNVIMGAVSTQDLKVIHENFFNKYGIGMPKSYVINEDINRSAYDAIFKRHGQKPKKTCYFLNNGKIKFQSYSYELTKVNFMKIMNAL